MKLCKNCNEPFAGKKFCSLSCSVSFNNKLKTTWISKQCKLCGKDISGPKSDRRQFCNRNCSGLAHYGHLPKKEPEGECDYCHQICSTSRKYCSKECGAKARMARYRVPKSKHVRNYRIRQKQLCVDYKGGKCQICSYTTCLDALEFHHLESDGKDFNVSTAISRQKSFDQIKIELDKCILLCCRCHREEHHRLRESLL